ncbi:collagen alpha-3(VI) chain-like [Ruditapes philippinarum]|uniref:collagen alpha-3(VI) chain-like n=1 Tax=Ruditapes philippinarum TaxID=129788 RepID=UPI00295BE90E|nr:collagen alpha-3(VI) chain-like [Ruditapes philippinarum]
MATEDCLQTLLKYTMFGCDKCSTNVSDVAIVMDVSANINHKDFDMQVKAVSHLLTLTNVGPNATQFSYSMFTNDTVSVYNFTTHHDRVSLIADDNKKTRQKYNKNVNITRALNDVNKNGFSTLRGSRPYARKILVLVTSGNMNDTQGLKKAAKRVKDSGIIIVTIGTGRSANWINLRDISSDPMLTFVLGDDIHIGVNVLDSLRTTLLYDYCSNV